MLSFLSDLYEGDDVEDDIEEPKSIPGMGDRLRELRKQLKMTQEDVAEKIGYAKKGPVSAVEHDKALPRLIVLMRWCDALSADICYVVTGQNRFSERTQDAIELWRGVLGQKGLEFAGALTREELEAGWKRFEEAVFYLRQGPQAPPKRRRVHRKKS